MEIYATHATGRWWWSLPGRFLRKFVCSPARHWQMTVAPGEHGWCLATTAFGFSTVLPSKSCSIWLGASAIAVVENLPKLLIKPLCQLLSSIKNSKGSFFGIFEFQQQQIMAAKPRVIVHNQTCLMVARTPGQAEWNVFICWPWAFKKVPHRWWIPINLRLTISVS